MSRLDRETRAPIGTPVTGLGRDIGRARLAFGDLWMTVPGRGQVLRLRPTS